MDSLSKPVELLYVQIGHNLKSFLSLAAMKVTEMHVNDKK